MDVVVLRPCSMFGVLSRGTRCARHRLTRPTTTQLGLGSTLEDPVRVPALADDELKTYLAFQAC